MYILSAVYLLYQSNDLYSSKGVVRGDSKNINEKGIPSHTPPPDYTAFQGIEIQSPFLGMYTYKMTGIFYFPTTCKCTVR